MLKNKNGTPVGVPFLFDFLLKVFEFLGVKKFNQSDSESVTEHFQRDDPGIDTLPV